MIPKHFILLLVGLVSPCWSVPQYGGGDSTIPEQSGDIKGGGSQCGHASYDCVPYFQCVDGVINTDGSGLLDLRVQRQGTCVNPDYPEVPAVCCLIPGSEPTPPPVQTCPDYQECVDYSLCSADGTIVTDGSGLIDIRSGYVSCWLSTGIGGRCCSPPVPYVDSCPEKSVCVPGNECLGTALDASNVFLDYVSTGVWSQCSYGAGDGVCCIPKALDKCPGESVCLDPINCLGQALDSSSNFVDYIQTGSWSHCSEYEGGVCCINKKITPILTAAKHCGVRNYKLDQRIAAPHAENEAAFGEFPWQAILFYQNYTFICGASLISNKHLLTAAHCVNNLHASDIRVRLGEWTVSNFDEALPYVDQNVHSVHIHPKFNARNVHNDIAILELVKPIELQYHINTICLPTGQKIDPYTICYASGWGKDSFEGEFQHTLKKIGLPYVDRNTCQGLLRKTRLGRYFRLHKSFVCAGGEENKDACYGDGGGPLVCKDPAKSQYVLTGITAWGIGCGSKDVPGVYVDVQHFVDWIEGLVGKGGGGGQQQQYGK